MDKEVLLEIKDLKIRFYTYDGTVEAVDVENLTIYKGEILGLVGETGCGKTVTSLSILNLIPKPGKIESGKIILRGENLLEKGENELKALRGSKIAMIFQDPMSSLNPVFTVGEQLTRVIMLHQKELDRRKATDKAMEMLKLIGLPHVERIMKSYPHELSGGMRQRIMIAMALSCRPELIIADEPTSALDVTTEAQILKLIKDLRDQYGTSILFVTHDLAVVAQICDRVAVMYAGEVIEVGRVKDVFEKPLHPYTVGLLEAMPKPNKRKSKLMVIGGTVPSMINPPSGCRFHPRCQNSMEVCLKNKPKMKAVGQDHYVSCFLWGN
ncbi:MAG: ABC transporter ATP-binding protein [Candidatus Bathyarchaeia archaeon]